MLVAGVDVCLSSHQDDAVEVVDVDVHKDTKEPAQDFLTDLNKVLGEWNSYRNKQTNKQKERVKERTLSSIWSVCDKY